MLLSVQLDLIGSRIEVTTSDLIFITSFLTTDNVSFNFLHICITSLSILSSFNLAHQGKCTMKPITIQRLT